RGSAQSIIDDFVLAGVNLSPAQRQSILDWGAERIGDQALMNALNPAGGSFMTEAQQSLLLSNTLPSYETKFLAAINGIDAKYALGGALNSQFAGPSFEKIELISKLFNSGSLYDGISKSLAQNNVAELVVQLQWMYSSVHDGNKGVYSAGLQSRFQESSQNILNAYFANTAIFPNGASAQDRANV